MRSDDPTPAPALPEDATLDLVAWAEARTWLLYEGVEVAHRSCGIALAETFGLPSRPYQAMRCGGITGCGECGAIKAGELILGELLGDSDPTGAVTPSLARGAARYRALWQQEVDRGSAESIICNDLTGQFATFHGPERAHFCTRLAATVSRCVARVLLEEGATITPTDRPTR